MSLQDIVQVTITKETASVARTGFGIPMILSYFTQFTERARVYETLAELEADGFGASNFAHKAASAIFSQNPKVSSIVVGRRNSAVDRAVTLTPTASPPALTAYKVTINDQVATFTTNAAPTVAEVTAGLETAINALMPAIWLTVTPYVVGDRRKLNGNIYQAVVAGTTGATGPSGTKQAIVDGTVTWKYIGPTVTATDTGPGTSVVIAQDTAGAPFLLEVEKRALLTQKDNTPDPGIVADLTAVRTALDGNDSWYGLITDSHGEIEIALVAAAVESLRKFYLASCADDEILTGSATDLASDLEAANYARTALLWSTKPHTFPEAAWVGRVFPLDPGSETWKFKTLTGIAADTLSSTEQTNLDAKKANHYQLVAGVNITAEGVTSSGEFIDVTRFIDSLQADIEESVFERLAALPKAAFTDSGIAIVENEVRGALLRGVETSGLAADPAPTVTVPLASAVSGADKNARILRDVTFTATLAGAIHNLIISGRLSV